MSEINCHVFNLKGKKTKGQNVSNLISLLAALLLVSVLAACGSGANISAEAQIREYLYRNQPTSGQQFVEWANKNLPDYPARRVYRALQDEARSHAKLGHPNAIVVLSFAAQSWAKEKSLPYNRRDWVTMHQEAIANLRDDPGELQLWPPEE